MYECSLYYIEALQCAAAVTVVSSAEGPERSKMAANIDQTTTSTPSNLDKYTPSEYTQHLDISQQEQYKNKLDNLNILDPYCVPQAVFTTLTDSELPDLQYFDIQAYLLQFPSKYTGASLKAVKSLDGYQYYIGGLVINPMMWHLPHKKLFVAISKVRTSNHLTACGNCLSYTVPCNQNVDVITDLI